MAENKKVVIDIEATSTKSVGDATMSLKQLRDELKKAKSAALNGDGKAAKRVAELTDKMDDLRDSTKTLQGSGLERITSSFGLLGEGFKNFDFDKIKAGFSSVGAAMKAIPIFLIAEGISYLIENWKELSEGNGILAKTLQGVTAIFEKLGEEIDSLTDTLGLTNTQLEKQGDIIKDNAEKSKEALSGQMNAFDRQIAVAKASGESTIDLEKAKQQAIIDTNLAVARQIEAFVRAGGEFDEEKRKLLTASLEAIKGAKVQEYVIEQEHSKKLNDEYKKRVADKKKSEEDMFAAALAEQEKEEAERTRFLEIDKKKAEEAEKAAIAAKENKAQEDKDELDKINKEREENRKRLEEDAAYEDELNRQNAELAFQTSTNTANAIAGLSETIFQIKMANVKKGSKEEEKAAKKNFKVQKAMQLALAGIDGAKAITASLAAAPLFIGAAPNPAGIAGLAAAIATTGASIATIAARQFDASQWVAPNIDESGGGGGALGGGQAPNTAPPRTTPTTGLDDSGRVINRDSGEPNAMRAYVVESEMTDKQRRVKRLENQASFG